MEALGLDRAALLDASPWPKDGAPPPNGYFEVAAVRRVWHRAAELSQDPLLGLKIGVDMPLQAMNVLSIVLMHSPTLRAAFANLDRYERLVGNNGHFSAQHDTSGVRLSYVPMPSHVPLHYMQPDSVLSALLRLLRLSGLADLAPRQVVLTSPHFALRREYEAFFGCPVHVAAEMAGMEFDYATWDRPLPNADPGLLEMARAHAETLLMRQATLDSLTQSVRALLGARRFGRVSCTQVARDLGISGRTLQRRLAQTGHTFRELFDAARMDEALHLLTRSTLPLSEIADRLGYSEPSALSRAVRHRFGASPRHQRSSARLPRSGTPAPR
jgi:AraC-like DNA-binding protein